MTSHQFTPALNAYAALRSALDRLASHGYFATHATALAEDPDNYVCRCCTVVPDAQRDRYAVVTGGAGTTCTAALIAERGDLHVTWAGDAAEIVAVLVDRGLDASWDGDPGQCIKIALTDKQRDHVAARYRDEIVRFEEPLLDEDGDGGW